MVCDVLSLQSNSALLSNVICSLARKCVPFKAHRGPRRTHCLNSAPKRVNAPSLCGLQEGYLADGDALQMGRRALLTALSSAMLCTVASPAMAGGNTTVYDDERDHFQISVPQDWVAAEGAAEGNKGFTGASGSRRALAWFPESGTSTNVTILVTNVGADYTGLGSFGTAETFGQNLISSLDRSFLLRSGFNRPKSVQVARLLDAKARSNMYFLEYTVQKEDENEPRHFLSAVSLGFNGRYNRFYTLTAQCPESEVPTYKGTLESIVNSFKPPAPVI